MIKRDLSGVLYCTFGLIVRKKIGVVVSGSEDGGQARYAVLLTEKSKRTDNEMKNAVREVRKTWKY